MRSMPTPTPGLDALALEAFIYAWPVREMVRMRAANSPRRVDADGAANPSPEGRLRWCNALTHTRKLLGAGGSRVVTPNNDTLYSNAWMDLQASPLVIDVPDTAGRYYVLGLLDFYTNPFAHLGARLHGTRAGAFLITGPGWQGTVPEVFKQPGRHVVAPTRWVWLIGRMLVDGDDDLPTAHALQDRFRMRRLEDWLADRPSAALRFDPGCDPHAPLQARTFITQVNRAMRENPPPPGDAPLLDRYRAVGVGPQCPDEPDPQSVALMARALDEGMRVLQASNAGGIERNGWTMPALLETDFGSDHLRRAAIALKYIGALESREAIYPMVWHDQDGQPLSGEHAYRLHFPPGRLPAVDGFWSLTMYGRHDFMLVPNAIGRFAIGDRTPGLRHGEDGSLTLHIQHAMPSDPAVRANWLPAPISGFYLCLRAYLPRPEMLEDTYALPPLSRIEID